MKFTTRMPPEGDEYDGKLVATRDDVAAWVAAGRPPLSTKQLSAFARTVAYGSGEDPADVVALAKAIRSAFLLSQPPARPVSPSRVPSNPTSSRPTKSGRTVGNGPKPKIKTVSAARKKARRQMKAIRRHLLARGVDPGEVKIMSAPDTDPELRTLWLEQLGLEKDSQAVTLDSAIGEEARMMLASDTDPELRVMWLSQLANREPAPTAAPLAMDKDRYRLHTEAKQLAQTRCDANPRLDPAEAYCLAAVELEDRRNPGVI